MDATKIDTNEAERRQDARYIVDDNFEVKILFSSDDPKILGKTFGCSAIDVSKSGVQIISEELFAVKSVLDISIKVNNSKIEYQLTGNVKWCRPGKGIGHSVGIQLKERSGTATDLDDWKSLIKNLK